MALVACLECGKNVSTLAAACVSCGAPVDREDANHGHQGKSLASRLVSLVIYLVGWALATAFILVALNYITPAVAKLDQVTTDSMTLGPDEICVLFLNEGIRNGAATGEEDLTKCVKELTFMKEQRPDAFREWAGCISDAGGVKEAMTRCEI